MEPDESELPGLRTLGPLLEWCGLALDGKGAEAFRGVLQLTNDASLRPLARIPRPDYDATIATIKSTERSRHQSCCLSLG